jgi:hypothetical protein
MIIGSGDDNGENWGVEPMRAVQEEDTEGLYRYCWEYQTAAAWAVRRQT